MGHELLFLQLEHLALVDDGAKDTERLARALGNLGYDAKTVVPEGTGVPMKDIVQLREWGVLTFIVDLEFHGMHDAGLVVMQEISAAYSKLPVLILALTLHADDKRLAAAALAAGASLVIRKGMRAEEDAAAVDAALRSHWNVTRLPGVVTADGDESVSLTFVDLTGEPLGEIVVRKAMLEAGAVPHGLYAPIDRVCWEAESIQVVQFKPGRSPVSDDALTRVEAEAARWRGADLSSDDAK